MIAWDTETRSFRWWENAAFLASWSVDDQDAEGQTMVVGHDPKAEPERLRALLESDKHLVGANSKFDAHMTREATGLDVLARGSGYTVDDVLLMSKLWFGARRSIHGLKELTTDLIDPTAKEAEEAMAEAYHAITGRTDMKHDDAYYVTWQHNPADVERYAGLDAVDTRNLYKFFKPRIDSDPKLASLYLMEREVQTVLYEAEKIGVRVDQSAVARLGTHYRDRDAAARSNLEATIGFIPEGEGSTERLREALIDAGVPLTEVTEKTGELAVNRKALQKHADHPAVAALLEWRRIGKFLSTYIGPLERLDGDIVHPTFKQAEAWTGRMSGADPNMQNIPKRTDKVNDVDLRIRSVFVPREGMEFIVADFDAIEMRVLAHYLGDRNYQDLIANGDPHSFTAAAAFSQVSPDPKDFGKDTENRWLRDIAKQATYGIVYGGGGPVIMDTINKMVVDAGHPEFMVDLEQARAIRRKISGTIPGFKAFTESPYGNKEYPQGRLYQQLLKSQEGDFGYVRTIGGRKQWIKLEKAYVALSGLIQGSAADIMKQAAINVSDALRPHGGYPLLFVHDEVVAEVPKGQGEELKPLLVEAMRSAAVIRPSLEVEANVTDRSYAHA